MTGFAVGLHKELHGYRADVSDGASQGWPVSTAAASIKVNTMVCPHVG